MDMIRVTEGEFLKDFDAICDRAVKEPVIITKQGQDYLVILSAEEYARLKSRDSQVGLAEDAPNQ